MASSLSKDVDFAAVNFEIVAVSISTTQHPHFVPKANRFTTQELFATVVAEVWNHLLVDTEILVELSKFTKFFSQVIEERPQLEHFIQSIFVRNSGIVNKMKVRFDLFKSFS